MIVGQRTGIPHKPDPAGLWEILRAPAWSATPSVLIGDSVIDIQTAKAANIDSIAVTWGYHDTPALQQAHPTKILHQVSDLTEALLCD